MMLTLVHFQIVNFFYLTYALKNSYIVQFSNGCLSHPIQFDNSCISHPVLTFVFTYEFLHLVGVSLCVHQPEEHCQNIVHHYSSYYILSVWRHLDNSGCILLWCNTGMPSICANSLPLWPLPWPDQAVLTAHVLQPSKCQLASRQDSWKKKKLLIYCNCHFRRTRDMLLWFGLFVLF